MFYSPGCQPRVGGETVAGPDIHIPVDHLGYREPGSETGPECMLGMSCYLPYLLLISESCCTGRIGRGWSFGVFYSCVNSYT